MTRLLILLFCFSQSVQAAENGLGMLFFTPQERARLDALPRATAAVDGNAEAFFVFDGEVRRSSGKDTHWVNGQTKEGRANPRQRYGETIDTRTGAVISPLGNGKIRIHPTQ